MSNLSTHWDADGQRSAAPRPGPTPPATERAAALTHRSIPALGPLLGSLTAAAALALSTLVCLVIERQFDPANLITVYLAAVVVVALRRGRAAAVATTLGAIVLFDLLFVAPRWSLKPADPQYFFTFAVMLVVGLIVSQLASHARQEAASAQARARRAQALNQLAMQLAQARTGDAIAAALSAAVRQAVGAAAELLLCDADGSLPQPLAHRRCVPLLGAEGPLGVLAIDPVPHEHDHPQDQELLEAIALQGAVVLERSLFEQRSARAAVEAERERLRSTLLAGISHDFRTPLTTIVGSTTSLLEQGHAIDEAHREALLRGVLLEARRLHAQTSDLLDLTRMEEGSVRPSPEWVPADELVAEARAALGQRLDRHRLRVAVDGDTVVWCDPRLLEQALVNLIDNALRHTPPGSEIRVGVSVLPGWWRLVVHDNGPGIPVGQERNVFKKFFRVRQDPDARGTGLGLAICAVVAELHGGQISVSNDQGARFELCLPQPDDTSARLPESE
jgi:two-component system sensor histidine kinase KdpD